MKSGFFFVALLVSSVNAFVPMATRAVGKPKGAGTKVVAKAAKAAPKKAPKVVAKKVVAKKAAPKKVAKKVVAKKAAPKKVVAKKAAPKKVVAKKVVAKKAAPKKAAPAPKKVVAKKKFGLSKKAKLPSVGFSAPTRVARKPVTIGRRVTPITKPSKVEYVYDDGLTVLERKQRGTLPAFLTGSAKSQADKTTIRPEIIPDDSVFGISNQRFQVLSTTLFLLITLSYFSSVRL
eukprot:CAMPEP_0118675132 /NCGR_PEP_ID=MMETSP0800-20121206/1281_1 /TAXON_ID=210618 ORGANISM="Striatella unipunctata, Strain CCMP2910" /NCGR_SAMPLE_ID=MMETSP0800 /ASSEMBLY_ACC=CAM_ASM_000638 /LENGTH=232 /DNA_ID=CAMNT_0006570419 /DNA_START=67 /DNA_END=765 /DNA_ORIENTATION=+